MSDFLDALRSPLVKAWGLCAASLTLSLTQVERVFSILALLLTCIYTAIKIWRELRRKDNP